MKETRTVEREGESRTREYTGVVLVFDGSTARAYTDKVKNPKVSTVEESERGEWEPYYIHKYGWEIQAVYEGDDEGYPDSEVRVGDIMVTDLPEELIKAMVALENQNW